MASLQLFKIRINNACKLVKSHESQIENIDVPFTFPTLKEECEQYIKEKMGLTTNLLNSLHNAVKLQETQINSAIEYISARNEEKERDKLMMELSKHLEMESLDLEVIVVQWRTRIEFRQHELKEQGALLHCDAPSIPSQPSGEVGQAATPERNERQIKIRKPMLEIPTFSGNFREFNSFWTVFESLIHTDDELSDTDKFLFLKQALKGKAATTISCIPVVGGRYQTAIDILKKHFDRSANMADILINEIEKLPRASDDPKNCRNTFEAIIHLEQTGAKMNADRVWRRIIFSKFPESICTSAIQKEALQDDPFDVSEILNTIDSIILLRETISLTMETLFSTDHHSNNQENEEITRCEAAKHFSTPKRLCLCGQPHSPYTCQTYPTPDARRVEATNQGVCWRCFASTHSSNACTNTGVCPKCSGSHHGSLCFSKARQSSRYPTHSQSPSVNHHQRSPTSWSPRNTNQDRHEMSNMHVVQGSRNEQEVHNPDIRSLVQDQCVLQIASALIFNEAEWDYQPATILLDSGAQRSFVRSGLCEELNLPVARTTSFTTSGMGEQQEQFSSSEVHITLKSLHGSEKLKKLSLYTKQKLTTHMQTAILTKADLSYISNEKLIIAQGKLSHESVSPDLIIGQDLLNLVTLHKERIRKLPSGLILTPTIFGYVISGTSRTTTNARLVGTFGCISKLHETSRNDRSAFQHHNERLAKPRTCSDSSIKSTRTDIDGSLTNTKGTRQRRTFTLTKLQQASSKGGQSRFTRHTFKASIFDEARADRQRWLNTIRSISKSDMRSVFAMKSDYDYRTALPWDKRRVDDENLWRRHRKSLPLIRRPPTEKMAFNPASTISPKSTRRTRRQRRAAPKRNPAPATTPEAFPIANVL